MRKRVLLVAVVSACFGLVAAFVWKSNADCLQLLQTAELAQGAEVHESLFGGCRVTQPTRSGRE